MNSFARVAQITDIGQAAFCDDPKALNSNL